MSFVTANHIQLYYETIGSGPDLLILGGLGDSVRNWRPVAKNLSDSFRVTLFDARGAGQSDHPFGPFDITTLAQDAAELLLVLGHKPSHILGFSMGGKTAIALSAKYPDLVDKLILVSTGAAFEPKSEDVTRVFTSHARTAEHFTDQFQILFGPSYQKRIAAKAFVAYKNADPHPQPEDMFRAQFEATHTFDGRESLAQITAPTLVLHGAHDLIVSLSQAQELAEGLPTGTLITYPDAGHVLPAEEPLRFVQDVKSFLLT